MLGIDTARALYRSHFIAPGHWDASRNNDLRAQIGDGDSVHVEVNRGALHPLLPIIRETFIDASRTTQRTEDDKIQTRELKTGVAVYSILGIIPIGRRFGNWSFRDFDGTQRSGRGVDMATLHSALNDTTLRRGAVTNHN